MEFTGWEPRRSLGNAPRSQPSAHGMCLPQRPAVGGAARHQRSQCVQHRAAQLWPLLLQAAVDVKRRICSVADACSHAWGQTRYALPMPNNTQLLQSPSDLWVLFIQDVGHL